MTKLFQHSAESPFHISVGAVLVNGDGKILVHTFSANKVPPNLIHNLGGMETISILMRESLENGESLEGAVARGLQEEFGMEGNIKKYLGSEQHFLETPGGDFEKTTLYFEVELITTGERPMDDPEAHSTLEWMDPAALVERMKEQGRCTERKDLDESKIVEAYVANK